MDTSNILPTICNTYWQADMKNKAANDGLKAPSTCNLFCCQRRMGVTAKKRKHLLYLPLLNIRKAREGAVRSVQIVSKNL
eukprot:1151102-Pelagomonas_calceolata.AAC.2